MVKIHRPAGAALVAAMLACAGLAAAPLLDLDHAWAGNGNGGGNGNGNGNGGNGNGNGGGNGQGNAGGNGQGNAGGNGQGNAGGNGNAGSQGVGNGEDGPPGLDGRTPPGHAEDGPGSADEGNAAGRLNAFLNASPSGLANASSQSAIGAVRTYGDLLGAYLADPTDENLAAAAAALAEAANRPLDPATVAALSDRLGLDTTEAEEDIIAGEANGYFAAKPDQGLGGN